MTRPYQPTSWTRGKTQKGSGDAAHALSTCCLTSFRRTASCCWLSRLGSTITFSAARPFKPPAAPASPGCPSSIVSWAERLIPESTATVACVVHETRRAERDVSLAVPPFFMCAGDVAGLRSRTVTLGDTLTPLPPASPPCSRRAASSTCLCSSASAAFRSAHGSIGGHPSVAAKWGNDHARGVRVSDTVGAGLPGCLQLFTGGR